MDFTNCKENLKKYNGAAKKRGIYINGEPYMLKFPNKTLVEGNMTYTNSAISEHLGCSIMNSLGFETQETILGTYKDKIVVACKDFETDGYTFFDINEDKNSISSFVSESNLVTTSSRNSTEIEDILTVIKNQKNIDTKELEKYFWEMFAGDTLIGNFDRHNGNWGYLINIEKNLVKIAPIFDCGSSLYPQADELRIKEILNNPLEQKKRIEVFPRSAIKINGEKINPYKQYIDVIKKYPEAKKALEKIIKRADLKKINSIINNTPYMSQDRKDCIKLLIKQRYQHILKRTLTLTKDKDFER